MAYRCSTCGAELPGLLSVCRRQHPASQPDPNAALTPNGAEFVVPPPSFVRNLQDRFAALMAERDSMERRARTYEAANTKLIAERDAARAENDTIRAANRNLEDKLAGLEILRERFGASNRDWVAIMLRDTARIRSLEAAAARLREALQAACRDPLTPECRYCGVHVLRGHASDCFVGQALHAYDQAMSPPSTRSADVSLKAGNSDTSGGETPGGDGDV